jgi:hypothetical protein
LDFRHREPPDLSVLLGFGPQPCDRSSPDPNLEISDRNLYPCLDVVALLHPGLAMSRLMAKWLCDWIIVCPHRW